MPASSARAPLALLLALALHPGQGAEPAAEAGPALVPKLLLVTRAGGPGDQWLPKVQVKGNRVVAAGPDGFSVVVAVDKDDDAKVTGTINGNRSAQQQVETNLPNGGKIGPVTFGYNQVDPILQLPFLKGPGWQLWGWSLAQAKASKAEYAPYMADSRIRTVTMSPHGTLFAVGTCDGGNTCLRAHPADIDRTLDFPIGNAVTGGGGGGRSSFCFEIDQKGTVLRQLVARGLVLGVAWDDWGRCLIAGQGVLKGDYRGGFGFGDGGGLLIADSAWKRMLFGTHFGPQDKGSCLLWGVSIDSASGLAAVSGSITGELAGVNALQAQAGGGHDGFLAVFRLWSAADAAAAKAAAKPARIVPVPGR